MKADNKLMAEFLGYTQPHPSYPNTTYWYKEGEAPLSVLLFHKDWNWLMLVVEKIESLSNDFSITTTEIQITFDNGDRFIIIRKVKNKIQAVHQACFMFIEWYNEQK